MTPQEREEMRLADVGHVVCALVRPSGSDIEAILSFATLSTDDILNEVPAGMKRRGVLHALHALRDAGAVRYLPTYGWRLTNTGANAVYEARATLNAWRMWVNRAALGKAVLG